MRDEEKTAYIPSSSSEKESSLNSLNEFFSLTTKKKLSSSSSKKPPLLQFNPPISLFCVRLSSSEKYIFFRKISAPQKNIYSPFSFSSPRSLLQPPFLQHSFCSHLFFSICPLLMACGTPFQDVPPRVKVLLQLHKARLIPYGH